MMAKLMLMTMVKVVLHDGHDGCYVDEDLLSHHCTPCIMDLLMLLMMVMVMVMMMVMLMRMPLHTTLHGLHVSKLSKSCLRGREIPSHDRIWELRDFDLSHSTVFALASLLSF